MKTLENNQKQEAFGNLVKRFGKKSGSHLFPLFNYFFVPQTKSQLKSWKKSIKGGIHNQNLLLNISDYELVKNFSPETTMTLTKSKTMCRISMDTFVSAVSDHILGK